MKNKILIILILLLAFALRFYKLESFPALNADEAAIGYNAYSLIETGKDEHGNPWPIHFESFGDYKPGLYFYLALTFVKFMGLNEWAVRIPGAFLGVATVYLVYLLVKELFKKTNLSFSIYHLALIASLMLAISPWHIHFSRGAWEVNVSTFFITLGIWLFMKAINKPKLVTYVFCIFSFVLSLYTYHAARIIVPLLGMGIFIIYRKSIQINIKKWLIAITLGLLLMIPLFKDLTGSAGVSRASGVSIFSDPGVVARINEQRGRYENPSGFLARALHNKPINYSIEFLENWLEHYSFEFLFKSGDEIERNKVPNTGQMYLFELPFLIVGLIYLIKSKTKNHKSKKIIFMWLIIAPFAAALTFQSPHALRAQNMVITLTIISSYGFYNLLILLRKYSNRTKVFPIYMLIICMSMVFSFYKYSDNYWNNMVKEYPFSSQYGVKELVKYVTEEESEYEKVVISDRYDQPYILFLFYMKYPPILFQENHELTQRDKFGFSTVADFDKYYFQKINYEELIMEDKRILIAGTNEEIRDNLNIIRKIYGVNNYLYFNVVSN